MLLAELHQDIFLKLSQAGIEGARSDTDLLLCYCLGLTRSQLILYSDKEVSPEKLNNCLKLVQRRLEREPLHYILGTREFWSKEFTVSPAVLIPRPETEFLLEQVLWTLTHFGYTGGPVMDMCTGSGVIAVVLAEELNAQKVLAVDRFEDALKIAAINVARHEKKRQVDLVASDLFSSIYPEIMFELIVSNPPYIAEDEIDGLQPEVHGWEPRAALVAGKEGLDIIKRLSDQVPLYLRPGGWLFIEIGAGQKGSVHNIFADHSTGKYEHVEILEDWSGRPRILKARIKRQ